MKPDRKITVHVPEELLNRARKTTGKGINETVRRGLELVAAAGPYARLRQLRGKVELPPDLDALREDRTGPGHRGGSARQGPRPRGWPT